MSDVKYTDTILAVECPYCHRLPTFPCQGGRGIAQRKNAELDPIKGGVLGAPDRAKAHHDRLWQANVSLCLSIYGTHDWWPYTQEFTDANGASHFSPIHIHCARECGAYSSLSAIVVTPSIQRELDRIEGLFQDARQLRDLHKRAYLDACHTLKWEEHYEYEFELTPLDGNPFKTGTGGTDRWEVSAEGKLLGRITRHADDQWAAYSYSIFDEYTQRVGFFDTKEEACRALA